MADKKRAYTSAELEQQRAKELADQYDTVPLEDLEMMRDSGNMTNIHLNAAILRRKKAQKKKGADNDL